MYIYIHTRNISRYTYTIIYIYVYISLLGCGFGAISATRASQVRSVQDLEVELAAAQAFHALDTERLGRSGVTGSVQRAAIYWYVFSLRKLPLLGVPGNSEKAEATFLKK